MAIRGYIESDCYCDTHGFEESGKQVWVEFRPGGWNDRGNVRKRSVWVDHLGDFYVLGLEGGHFERLVRGDAVLDWDWVDGSYPDTPPERMWEEVAI